MHNELIKSIINQHSSIFGVAVPNITPLPRGAWNSNYLVQVGNCKFVFKVYPYTHKFETFGGNDPLQEYKTLQILMPYHIAPEPVLFIPKKEAQPAITVYKYIEGEQLTPSEASAERVGEILGTLHAIPTNEASFLDHGEESAMSLLQESDRMLQVYMKKKDTDQQLINAMKEYLVLLTDASSSVDDFKRTIVHTDPVPSNFVGNPAIMIDWQRPTIGDPAFDCWAFTADIFNWWDWKKTLTSSEIEAFWNVYLKISTDHRIRERTLQKSPFYYARMLLYCLNRYHDFSHGVIPQDAREGRELLFQQYPTVVKMCRANLRLLFKDRKQPE